MDQGVLFASSQGWLYGFELVSIYEKEKHGYTVGGNLQSLRNSQTLKTLFFLLTGASATIWPNTLATRRKTWAFKETHDMEAIKPL
jgi:hypothetical protein